MRVAVVTVGDEILKGDTVNSNAAWLGRQLGDRGVDVERVVVVPDRVADIAEAVDWCRSDYDAVILTGGLGPTLDDLTMEGVSVAFGVEMEEHEAALAWLDEETRYTRDDLAEGTADLPAGAQMLPNPEGVAPGCVMENVYVLPGVPEEMRGMFEVIADDFSGRQRHVDIVRADEPESALLDLLVEVRDEFDVRVGSYPGDVVRVRLEGHDETRVADAATWLRDRVNSPDDYR